MYRRSIGVEKSIYVQEKYRCKEKYRYIRVRYGCEEEYVCKGEVVYI